MAGAWKTSGSTNNIWPTIAQRAGRWTCYIAKAAREANPRSDLGQGGGTKKRSAPHNLGDGRGHDATTAFDHRSWRAAFGVGRGRARLGAKAGRGYEAGPLRQPGEHVAARGIDDRGQPADV